MRLQTSGLGDGGEWDYLASLDPSGGYGAANSTTLDFGGGYFGSTSPSSSYPTSPNYGSSYPSNQSSPPSQWLNALTAGLFGASSILGARYAVPQLAPGQYLSTSPSGAMTTYQLGAGQSIPSLGGSSLTSLLPILLVGGLAIMLLGKK